MPDSTDSSSGVDSGNNIDQTTPVEPWWADQEEVVITGMSGRLPESDDLAEFRDNLLSGTDMVTENDRRWDPGFYDLPRRHGKIREIRKFDAAAFNIHPKHASYMDPQLRILIEVTFEAICDAGYNPYDLRGTRTGVFVGSSANETGGALTLDPETVVGYTLPGCVRAMFANRVSHAFDFRGPSYTVDTACSSSLLCMELALASMRRGECDSAIVAGTHLTIAPTTALLFLRLGLLSQDGSCKSLDASGDGYCRSEGIVSIFLQKAPAARRIYATVVHAKTNTDGYKEQGILFPSGERQLQLLREVYQEAGVDPSTVAFVEAHGTGTKVGDPQEAGAIVEVFCKNRRTPLLIGSVKSNMGHAEPTSGMASVVKVLLAMETGILQPNLHYKKPNPYIPALKDGRLQVVVKPTKWSGGIVGVNSFGFGGSNVHAILKSFQLTHEEANDKSNERPASEVLSSAVPKLICCSGRTVEAVQTMFTKFEEVQDNSNAFNLMAELSSIPPVAHPYRGYTILGSTGPKKDIQKVPAMQQRRPIWFVYSGMGTQWPGMGRDLMKIEAFRSTVVRCSEALRPFGFNIYDVLMKGGEKTFDGPLNTTVCLMAIQVGLTDVLRNLGITPDGLVGHSAGEIACGYADGCMSAEDTVKLAYHRGKIIEEANFAPGAMAAVGLTWEDAKVRCPKGVVPACHNAKDSVTISGPKDVVSQFVADLESEDVFAKEINTAGIAYHSYFMQTITNRLTEKFEQVLTNPKPRSQKWISTSVPEWLWETSPIAQHCSASYLVNNVTAPVMFHEALQKIPENAAVIEVSPHALLQAILKRSLPPTATLFPLQHSKQADNLIYFYENMGKLYESGATVRFQHLYGPPQKWPVPRGTPMLGPIIKWDHSQDWPIITKEQAMSLNGGSAAGICYTVDPFNTDTKENKDKFLLHHVVDGRALYPFTGYAVMVWKTLAKLQQKKMEQLPVIIEDLTVSRPVILQKDPVKFQVFITPANGVFEVVEQGALVASGKISVADSGNFFYEELRSNNPEPADGTLILESQDVYKDFRLRGYDYGKEFRQIRRASDDGKFVWINWPENWVSFLDNMLQGVLLMEKGEALKFPVRLRYMRIDPEHHREFIREVGSDHLITQYGILNTHGIVAGGVEMKDLDAISTPRRLHPAQNRPTIERMEFVPFFEENCLTQRVPDLYQQCAEYLHYLREYLMMEGQSLAACLDINLPSNSGGAPDAETVRKLSQFPLFTALKKLCELDWKIAPEIALHSAKSTVESNAMYSSLNDDPLWSLPQHQALVKPLVDIVLQNTAGHRGRLGVWRPSSIKQAKNLKKMFESNPMVTVDMTLAGPHVDLLSEEAKKATLVTKVLNIDDHLSGEKCSFFYADALRLEENPVDTLRKLAEFFVTPAGFILVSEIVAKPAQIVVKCLEKSQFLISPKFHTDSEWKAIFAQAGLHVVASRTDGLMFGMYLLRSSQPETKSPAIVFCDDIRDFSWLRELQSQLEERKNAPDPRVWAVAQNATESGLRALARCIKEEDAHRIQIRSIMNTGTAPVKFDENSSEIQAIFARDLACNEFHDGHWGTSVFFSIAEDELATKIPCENAHITVQNRGDLSTLRWMESANKFWKIEPTSPQSILCHVYYAALNFRDIMLATGRIPIESIPGNFTEADSLLGMEFAGRSATDGRRLMGLLPAQALATTVAIRDPRFCWPVPPNWSLEEAATVPIAYATAYYSLICRGRLQKGERILIHSGAGGVGIAAIAVALSLGCDVFVTVGSAEKREFLMRRFPKLRQDQFFNSRSVEFEQKIMDCTDSHGVDVVLNSLSEDKLQASVRCMAPHGRFLEIGKFDMAKNSPLGLGCFLKNITFHGILLDALFDCEKDGEDVCRLLNEGIEKGVVQPLAATVFQADEVDLAFRYMAQGKHMGKIVVKIREEEPDRPCSVPKPIKVPAIPRTLCDPTLVYLIFGGLGGLGLELTNFLFKRGAKKFCLTSKSGIKSAYQKRVLAKWQSKGAQIAISTKNAAIKSEAEELMQECKKLGPVGGIFQLAGVLKDALFDSQTLDDFLVSAEGKYIATKNLDDLSRADAEVRRSLHWFVAFSSVACGRGNAGQSSYGWSNAAMERVVELRRADGLPGVAIQWGAIGDTGMVADLASSLGDKELTIAGTVQQRIPSVFAALDRFLSTNGESATIYSCFVRAETAESIDDETKGGTDALLAIAKIIGVTDLNQVDPDKPFTEMGIDSLMAMEIRQVLESRCDVTLPLKDLRTMTLGKLRDRLAGKVPTGEKSSADETQPQEQRQLWDVLEQWGIKIDVETPPAVEVIVPLNTPSKTGPNVFFVHGIEGVASTLQAVGRKMDFPTYCFQCVDGASLDSIESLAEFYVKHLKQKQPQGPYHIVGYSYGANVAYEMAHQLQQSGSENPIGSLILVDASHLYWKAYGDLYRKTYQVESEDISNDAQFETELLCAITTLDSWKSRLNYALDALIASNSNLKDNRQNLYNAFDALVRKFQAADKYRPVDKKRKFSGNVTLIRAENGALNSDEYGEDYGLAQIVTGPLDILVVPGDHTTCVQGTSGAQVAALINKKITKT